jgi:phage terminase large subunit GpA-like protein
VTLGKGDASIKDAVQRSFARDPRGRRMRDVPLLLFSPDPFKDMIVSAMRRTDPGPIYMHFPQWLPAWFFDELRAETRQPSGKWKKIRARNEALDLWAMIWALSYALGPADPRRRFSWASPPPWAAPLESNPLVMTREERRQTQASSLPAASQPTARRRFARAW